MKSGQLKDKRGFTIVELLIVIVVIAILAAISVVAYSGIQTRARDTQRQQDIKQLATALEYYYSINGRYPTSSGCGSTTINASWCTTADPSWQSFATTLSNYLSALPEDPVKTAGGNVQASGNYNYAYFSAGSYCNGTMSTGQGYLLVYRQEGSSQTNTLTGDCTTTPVGPYSGASNYRIIR